MSYRHLVEAVISAEAKAKEVAAMKAKAQEELRRAEDFEKAVSANLRDASRKLADFEDRVASLEP